MSVVKKKSLIGIAAVSVALAGTADATENAAGITWPSDFWQQVTNRIEAVAPVPFISEEADGFQPSGIDGHALSFTLGTEDDPFDSRILAEKTSEELDICSFPSNFAVTIR